MLISNLWFPICVTNCHWNWWLSRCSTQCTVHQPGLWMMISPCGMVLACFVLWTLPSSILQIQLKVYSITLMGWLGWTYFVWFILIVYALGLVCRWLEKWVSLCPIVLKPAIGYVPLFYEVGFTCMTFRWRWLLLTILSKSKKECWVLATFHSLSCCLNLFYQDWKHACS